MTSKVIVAGGRNFNNYPLLCDRLDLYLKDMGGDIEIVSGTAKGADLLGEQYAKEKGYPVKRFPADWDAHGKKAGYIRNKQMADYATHCVVFWDGKSKGSKMMIDICKDKGIPHRVVMY